MLLFPVARQSDHAHYTPSEESGLLDEGIDRYLGISPHKAFAVELEEHEIRDDGFQ